MMTLYVIVQSDCIRVICAFYRENPSCLYKVPASFFGSNPNFTRPNVGYLPVVGSEQTRERESGLDVVYLAKVLIIEKGLKWPEKQ